MKWYEDPVYIKMSEKSEEIQKLAPIHLGDDGRFKFTRFGDFLYVRVGGEPNDEGFYSRHKLVWLPRQDQLQEMVGQPNLEYLFGDFNEFINPDDYCTHTDHEIGFYANIACDDCREKRISVWKTFTSMEQLWLAFCQKELYNKVWDNEKEDWVNFTTESG